MQTVIVTGGDLYHLALQYLGDGTQWNRIAQANNLLDPVITGTMTLIIPAVNPQLTGGILVR
jgi:nucleoid-associated protein YgaU